MQSPLIILHSSELDKRPDEISFFEFQLCIRKYIFILGILYQLLLHILFGDTMASSIFSNLYTQSTFIPIFIYVFGGACLLQRVHLKILCFIFTLFLKSGNAAQSLKLAKHNYLHIFVFFPNRHFASFLQMSSLYLSQVDLVNIGSTDIVDGNHKLTLGLIWNIILHWQVRILMNVSFLSNIC